MVPGLFYAMYPDSGQRVSCSVREEAHPLLWRRRVASRAARSELVELVLARLDDPYRRLRNFVPCSDDISEWFRDDRARLVREFLKLLDVRVLRLESPRIRAEVEGARLPFTRIAGGDDPLAVACRDSHHERMLDSVALANLLNEASHELEGRDGVILEAERERQVEEHL